MIQNNVQSIAEVTTLQDGRVRVSLGNRSFDFQIDPPSAYRGGIYFHLFAAQNESAVRTNYLLKINKEQNRDQSTQEIHECLMKIHADGAPSGIEPPGHLVSFNDFSGINRKAILVVKRKCDLETFIKSHEFKILPGSEYVSIIKQLTKSLHFLSKNRYTYFDAKPLNALVDLDEEGRVVLYRTDFDSVLQLPDPNSLIDEAAWQNVGKILQKHHNTIKWCSQFIREKELIKYSDFCKKIIAELSSNLTELKRLYDDMLTSKSQIHAIQLSLEVTHMYTTSFRSKLNTDQAETIETVTLDILGNQVVSIDEAETAFNRL